ncbi:hypothetical protein [Micromonospora chokoriensis]|uniref:hypothetical protein n=1 Tax=Micromonospora chokoriensis TaxID=356851 RepID=UPI0004C42B3D|nr:hypothetical protein [Micromonospora chokoriensis]
MLRVLAGVLPDTPTVVVLDELPWISEQDATFDGHLQVAWDRLISNKPVLLLLLGSDLHMMQRFSEYDRPFYGRATNMVLGPFNKTHTFRPRCASFYPLPTGNAAQLLAAAPAIPCWS